MAVPERLEVLPVRGLPEVRPGDDVAALIAAHVVLDDGDVVVVSSKVVSKAEGAFADVLPDEAPDEARRRVARVTARRIVAESPAVLVTETAHGLVCANGGIDASNVPGSRLLLLPADPDASARALRAALRTATGRRVAVVVSDTFGRPWRLGQTDVAVGSAGLQPLRDERGRADREGKPLEVTLVAVADEVAAAADLVRGKADGIPVVVVRGLGEEVADEDGPGAAALVRPPHEDLFRRGAGGLAAAVDDARLPRRPVPSADLAACLAAAIRPPVGAHVVTEADRTVIGVDGPPALAGAAAGLLRALLVDRGCVAGIDASEDRVVRVVAGVPAPGVFATPGAAGVSPASTELRAPGHR